MSRNSLSKLKHHPTVIARAAAHKALKAARKAVHNIPFLGKYPKMKGKLSEREYVRDGGLYVQGRDGQHYSKWPCPSWASSPCAAAGGSHPTARWKTGRSRRTQPLGRYRGRRGSADLALEPVDVTPVADEAKVTVIGLVVRPECINLI